ncbi:5-methylaminomethyl-2-thiouridylate-methyltransferase [Coniophora puteana RWD-64-598 SS2]|uniref:tRNA-5-taurinomethyluridine 2-sulfurtransferase n=1 Tax=Coniophora puteana (strain RWD-64-598) TaxID=741705 RepID=A0A5M3N039_CONPW|nr:5-methylaminomethyl-2-thiouridylate-methyltransferase [Coniophora puteana RWD-64-598 SS2]EIW84783.1 5-methylaminomethyl-2-thiouridylate-methyltransferase [Coniophora puteana RWD-64-598 SS2]
MSGGVDSSVTAKLLAEKDYDLSAIFMRNWDTRDESGTDKGCEWEKDWEDVQLVCKMLDIPCAMTDLSRQYWNSVFEPSLADWKSGFTPNPDVWCNKEIKFGALLRRVHQTADPDNLPWLATGHWAAKGRHIASDGSLLPTLRRPRDLSKDQTYYLSSISADSIQRALFPLADFTKVEIRELAEKWGLPTAKREESMGLCFVGEKRRFNDFLAQYLQPQPGSIVEHPSKRVLGTHQGLWNYTIGQGAKIAGLKDRVFVASKDVSTNTVNVVYGTENPALYAKSVWTDDFSWIWAGQPPEALKHGMKVRVKTRHVMQDVGCTAYLDEDCPGGLRIIFDEPQKAQAPGQIAVLYDGTWCLGCGRIRDAEPLVPLI